MPKRKNFNQQTLSRTSARTHLEGRRSIELMNLPNARSLSWMGLTRERWCRTSGQMSRLDMNTCQTSIKTDILFSAAVTHIPGLSRQTQYHHISSHRTELREVSSDRTKYLPNTYSRSTAETTMNPIGQNIPVICLHLEDTTNSLANF